MNFGEMIADTIAILKRPDKVADAGRAINDAIQQYSLSATFSQDLIENSVPIDGTVYAQNIVISTTFPRFRKIHYLKPNTHKKPLEHITPDKVVLPNGCEQVNKWYRSGDYIYFKLGTLASEVHYGYYAYPARLASNDETHWMLEVLPAMIRYKALGDLFDLIGEPSEATKFRDRANGLFLVAKEDLATAETH